MRIEENDQKNSTIILKSHIFSKKKLYPYFEELMSAAKQTNCLMFFETVCEIRNILFDF